MGTMKVVLALALLCSLATATPRFKQLRTAVNYEEPKVGCSLDEITKCAGEIQQAVDDCSHVTDVDSIVTCVNDILGASDCKKCVCDVLPFSLDFSKTNVHYTTIT